MASNNAYYFQWQKLIRNSKQAPTRFDPTTGGTWWLGQIPMDRLYLLELHNVSTGSWQPVISYVP